MLFDRDLNHLNNGERWELDKSLACRTGQADCPTKIEVFVKSCSRGL